MTEYYKQHPQWFSYSEEKGEYVFNDAFYEEVLNNPSLIDQMIEEGGQYRRFKLVRLYSFV